LEVIVCVILSEAKFLWTFLHRSRRKQIRDVSLRST
jgi:hypothetical protein